MIVTTIPNGKLIYQRISIIFHFINMNLPPTDDREMTERQPTHNRETSKRKNTTRIRERYETETIN